MAEDHNVDNHPDNNISHLPEDAPPDGTSFSNVRTPAVPDYKEDGDYAKRNLDSEIKSSAGGKEKRFYDIGLNPPGKGSLRNLNHNKAK